MTLCVTSVNKKESKDLEMTIKRWTTILTVILLAASAALYAIHFLIFKDAYHVAYYLLGDIAFLPLQALIAVLVLNRILEYRDRQARLEKLNMVIGAFFSEVGTHMLTYFSDMDPQLAELRKDLAIKPEWRTSQFNEAARKLRGYEFQVNANSEHIKDLRGFLISKREFLLGLLENPMVLEHEKFTGLLRAVFHLTEELAARPPEAALPGPDISHIGGDIERAYRLLATQWVAYMSYLGDNYPFLFSFALRTNPFDASASPVVKA